MNEMWVDFEDLSKAVAMVWMFTPLAKEAPAGVLADLCRDTVGAIASELEQQGLVRLVDRPR